MVCICFFQLSAEKYTEMCDLRQKAIQLEMNRQIQQRNNLMTTIQNTQDRAQVGSTGWSCLSPACGGTQVVLFAFIL